MATAKANTAHQAAAHKALPLLPWAPQSDVTPSRHPFNARQINRVFNAQREQLLLQEKTRKAACHVVTPQQLVQVRHNARGTTIAPAEAFVHVMPPHPSIAGLQCRASTACTWHCRSIVHKKQPSRSLNSNHLSTNKSPNQGASSAHCAHTSRPTRPGRSETVTQRM